MMNPRSFYILVFVATALFAGTAIRSASAGENLIKNPDFESGTENWGLFVPDTEKDKGCRLGVENSGAHTGASCAELSSEQPARFAITSHSGIRVQPGERYRVVAWVRADAGAKIGGRTPGILVRFILQKGNGDAADSPAVFVGVNNKVTMAMLKKPYDLGKLGAPLPTDWTKIEAVFEIPAIEGGVDSMGLGIFGQVTSGKFYVDDVSVEKVDQSVPLSPIVPSAAQ